MTQIPNKMTKICCNLGHHFTFGPLGRPFRPRPPPRLELLLDRLLLLGTGGTTALNDEGGVFTPNLMLSQVISTFSRWAVNGWGFANLSSTKGIIISLVLNFTCGKVIRLKVECLKACVFWLLCRLWQARGKSGFGDLEKPSQCLASARQISNEPRDTPKVLK